MALAWKMGYRSFDTALLYDNHKEIISILKTHPRKDYELTLKIPAAFHSGERLEELALGVIVGTGLGYIDTLLIHSPKNVNHPEALDAFQRMRTAGHIRNFGVSNYTLSHLKALAAFGYQPMVVQNEINPYLQETDFVNYCVEHNIEIQAHSIFATGKVFSDIELRSAAAPHDLTLALFSWMKKKQVKPVVSTRQSIRLLENLEKWGVAGEEYVLNNIERYEKKIRQCNSEDWGEFDLSPQDAYKQILRLLPSSPARVGLTLEELRY